MVDDQLILIGCIRSSLSAYWQTFNVYRQSSQSIGESQVNEARYGPGVGSHLGDTTPSFDLNFSSVQTLVRCKLDGDKVIAVVASSTTRRPHPRKK